MELEELRKIKYQWLLLDYFNDEEKKVLQEMPIKIDVGIKKDTKAVMNPESTHEK